MDLNGYHHFRKPPFETSGTQETACIKGDIFQVRHRHAKPTKMNLLAAADIPNYQVVV